MITRHPKSNFLSVFVLRIVGLLVSFFAVTPDVRSADLPDKLATTQPNTWVMLDGGGYGARNSAGLVFLPDEGRFVMLGGSCSDATRFSELTLNLPAGRWENRFPPDRAGRWGEPAGPSSAPDFDRYSAFRDLAGNSRPNLTYGYNHRMELWGNCALDRARGKIVVPWHILKRTSEYDVKSNTWQIVDSADAAPCDFWDDVVFGSMAYDPVNKEVFTGECRWTFRNGKWERQSFGSDLINGLCSKAEAVRLAGRKLLSACRARFYLTEAEAAAKVRMAEAAKAVAAQAAPLAGEIAEAAVKVNGYEKTQLGWAGETATRALTLLNKTAGQIAEKVDAESIAAAEAAWQTLDTLADDLSAAPPRRGYSGLTTDLKRGKIVLFGGHRLDRLVADTWVYDCKTRTWEQRRPKLSPSPRYGHGLTWLPDSGKVLLVDGSGYGGPAGQTWVYDLEANEWSLLAEGNPARPGLTSSASTWGWQPEPSAAGAGDLAVALCNVNREGRGEAIRYSTWVARIDASRVDTAGTTKLGVPPGTTTPIGGKSDDPRWYEQNAGTVDPAAQSAWIDKLPANTWLLRESAKNRPGDNRAWGTAAFDPDGEQVLHWGGGHVAYTGNAVLHYSTRANQYFIDYRPEQGLMYAHGQGGMKIAQTYRGRAFMTGHSYHSYAWDPPSKTLVVCGQDSKLMVKDPLFFIFDPAVGDWGARPIPSPFAANYSMTILCSMPAGAVAWNGQELWRVNVSAGRWNKLPLTGKLPGGGPDRHGMTYDAKRGRLLMFSSEAKGEVVAYDVKAGQATPLGPGGQASMPVLSSREVVYMPDADAVLLAACFRDRQGKMRWPIYDCQTNAWRAVRLGGRDPVCGPKDSGRDTVFNLSLGLMHDAKRRLVWAVDAETNVFALRLDLKSADVIDMPGELPSGPK